VALRDWSLALLNLCRFVRIGILKDSAGAPPSSGVRPLNAAEASYGSGGSVRLGRPHSS
jgi:hypothetical protein